MGFESGDLMQAVEGDFHRSEAVGNEFCRLGAEYLGELGGNSETLGGLAEILENPENPDFVGFVEILVASRLGVNRQSPDRVVLVLDFR